MVQIEEQNKVKLLLTEAITSLCKTGLKYETEFCIEGLLGITVDKKDILLVNIKEIVKPTKLHLGLNKSLSDVFNVVDNLNKSDENQLRENDEVIPKRRKKRKSSNVSKRKTIATESQNEIHDCDTTDLLSPVGNISAFSLSCDLTNHSSGNKKQQIYTSNLDDIPNLTDADITLPYGSEDGDPGGVSLDKDHSSCADTSSHSNVIFPGCKEEHFTLSSLSVSQHSPRISLGDGIPLDLGLGGSSCDNGDLNSSHLGSGWDDDMPLNLSDVQAKHDFFQKKLSCKECGRQYKTDQSLKKHRCKLGSNSLASDSGLASESTQQPLDLTVTTRPDGTFDDGFDPTMLGIDSDNEGDLSSLDNSSLSLTVGEQYLCICSRSFSDYSVYVDHVANCHKAKLTPYKACEICGKYFFSNSGYVKHKRLHLGVYKFHCDICHKGFFDRTHLRAHMDSTHSKVRRYECKHCNKSFFWKHHLKRHMGTCEQARMHSSFVESGAGAGEGCTSPDDTKSPPIPITDPLYGNDNTYLV